MYISRTTLYIFGTLYVVDENLLLIYFHRMYQVIDGFNLYFWNNKTIECTNQSLMRMKLIKATKNRLETRRIKLMKTMKDVNEVEILRKYDATAH